MIEPGLGAAAGLPPDFLPLAWQIGLALATQELTPRFVTATPADGRVYAFGREYQAVLPAAIYLSGGAQPGLLPIAVALSQSAFEGALNLQLLAADATGLRVRQALAFDAVVRFQAAEKLVAFEDRCAKTVDSEDPSVTRLVTGSGTHRALAGDPAERARVDQCVREIWGFTRKGTPRYPEHWSGVRTSQRLETLALERPAVARKFEALYREGYFQAASGRAAAGALEGDAPLRTRTVRWHRLMAFEMLLASVVLLATELDVRPSRPEHVDWLHVTRAEPGRIILHAEFARLAAES